MSQKLLSIEALVWLAAAVVLVHTASPRFALAGTNVVLGDSNSTPWSDDWAPWPVLLFGDDYLDKAHGGVSTYDIIAGCRDGCWWLNGTSADDVWWIMLGTNDWGKEPGTTAERYAENMLWILDQIPSQDVRLIASPPTRFAPTHDWNVHLREQAFIDALICNADPRVTCMADLAGVLSPDDHFDDIVHLNGEGHRVVAALLAVPEPSTGLLVAVAMLGLGLVRPRHRAPPP